MKKCKHNKISYWSNNWGYRIIVNKICFICGEVLEHIENENWDDKDQCLFELLKDQRYCDFCGSSKHKSEMLADGKCLECENK